MTILKFKKHVHVRRREPRREPQLPMSEPRKTLLGVVETDGEPIALDLPPNVDAATVQEAILRANAERAEKIRAESRELRRLFLEDEDR
jgi:hypothetical protein